MNGNQAQSWQLSDIELVLKPTKEMPSRWVTLTAQSTGTGTVQCNQTIQITQISNSSKNIYPTAHFTPDNTAEFQRIYYNPLVAGPNI